MSQWQAQQEAMNLDDLIARSLLAIDSLELRSKLAACVVLCGGPANGKGLIETVEERVLARIQEQ